jgi:hypothetical protein
VDRKMKRINKEKYTSYGIFGLEIFCKREDEIIEEQEIPAYSQLTKEEIEKWIL